MKTRVRLLLWTVLAVLLTSIVLTFVLHTPHFSASAEEPLPTAGGEWEASPALSARRRAGQYFFFVVGRDRASMCTDVMMLLSYDVAKGAITCMQLPRDTYVSYDGAKRLNAVFARGYAAAKRAGAEEPAAESAGIQTISSLVSSRFCVPIDFTVLLYLDGFSALVDAVGGVPMDVPFAMHYDDPAQKLHIHLEAGQQTLSGTQAEQFVRFRKTDRSGESGYTMGDLGRVNAQKLFLAALLRQVKSSLTPASALSLAQLAKEHCVTDLSLRDTAYFARKLLLVDPASVTLLTLPGWMGGGAYNLCRADTLRVLQQSFASSSEAFPEGAFDAALSFCNEESPEAKTIYYASHVDVELFSAESLEKDGFQRGELILRRH